LSYRRFAVEIYQPDLKQPQTRNFKELRPATAFVKEMYAKWLSGEANDPINYFVEFLEYQGRVNVTVVLRAYKGQRDPAPVFSSYGDSPQVAYDKLVAFLKSKKLDLNKVAVKRPKEVQTVVGPRGLDRYVKTLLGEKLEALPGVTPQAQLKALQELATKTSEPIVQVALNAIQQKKSLTPDQLKAIRNHLYRNRMRPEADLFRTAHVIDRLVTRFLTRQANDYPEQSLKELIAALRACQWVHWVNHWNSTGSDSYGDHLLFERLYDAIGAEVDGLAEKLLGSGDIQSINPVEIAEWTFTIVRGWAQDSVGGSLADLSLRAEGGVLEPLHNLLRGNGITIGTRNMLEGVADLHETHVYLLKQRLTPEGRIARRFVDKVGAFLNRPDSLPTIGTNIIGYEFSDLPGGPAILRTDDGREIIFSVDGGPRLVESEVLGDDDPF